MAPFGRRLRLLALAMLAVCTTSGIPANAYSLNGQKWSQSTVPYYINPANLDVSYAAAEAAVRLGADAWASQSGAAFAFSYAGTSTQTSNTYDGINLVTFRSTSNGSAIATAYTWYTSAGIVDADIVFWDGAFRFFTGTSGCSGGFYIEDVSAHEFGHALGLGHSDVPTATMFPSVSTCSMSPRSLDPDDIAGVRSLYPPETPSGPPGGPGGLRIVGAGS